MAEKRVYFDFAFLRDIDYIPLNEFINGRIYNIESNISGIYGPNDNPIVKSKLIKEGTNYYLYGYSELDEVVFVIGGYLPNDVYNNPYPMQYLIGVEDDSELYNILIGYADFVFPTTIQSKKYIFPITEKPFMSYNFNSLVSGVEKKISCLLDFKIGDTTYIGFDFTFEPNSNTPTYIFLYQSNGDKIGYTTDNIGIFFGNKIFEILNPTDIPEPIYNWLVNYLEEYVNPNTVINCYQYYSEHNRVDKSLFAIPYTTIEGVFRDDISITNPVFTVELKEFPKFNYIFIEHLNRYYFIDDIICVNKYLYEIHCSIDILMSYKDGIYKLKGFIDRNQFTQNKKLIDKRIVIEQGVDVDVNEITNDVFIPFNEMNDNALVYVFNGYKIDSSDKLAT